MKKPLIFLNVALLLICCSDSKTTLPNTCQISEPRILGTWKLVKECMCYTSGGDFIWKDFAGNFNFSFNDQCIAIQTGDTNSDCTEGKYLTKNDSIKVIFNCPSGTKSTNIWQYSFDSKGDTLLLKGFVDEGYIGTKYIKTQNN